MKGYNIVNVQLTGSGGTFSTQEVIVGSSGALNYIDFAADFNSVTNGEFGIVVVSLRQFATIAALNNSTGIIPGPIAAVRIAAGFLTSGLAFGSAIKFCRVELPVVAGQRLYIHAYSSGGSGLTSSTILGFFF